jgi:hypothetical protein
LDPGSTFVCGFAVAMGAEAIAASRTATDIAARSGSVGGRERTPVIAGQSTQRFPSGRADERASLVSPEATQS